MLTPGVTRPQLPRRTSASSPDPAGVTLLLSLPCAPAAPLPPPLLLGKPTQPLRLSWGSAPPAEREHTTYLGPSFLPVRALLPLPLGLFRVGRRLGTWLAQTALWEHLLVLLLSLFSLCLQCRAQRLGQGTGSVHGCQAS